MSSPERITRPIPDRTGPIRSWAAALGGSTAPDGDGRATGGTPVDEVVSRSVEVGYRVVDEYLRHGQRVAERIGDRSLTPGVMVQDFQELTARMARHASDLMDIWFQLIEVAASARTAPAPPPGDGRPEPVSTPKAAPAPASGVTEAPALSARVTIELASMQPAEVTLDLRPGAAPPLIVHALRAAAPDTPRLTDVALEPAGDGGALRLRVRVPPGHPPGVYNGIIIEERTSRPAGTVSVRIAGPA